MNRFVMLVAAGMVVLDVFAPVVRAQNYVVNGHVATEAEAQLLTSYSALGGEWRVDGYGSRGLPMSTRPGWCRSPARSAGTCSTSRFAIDLSRSAGSCPSGSCRFSAVISSLALTFAPASPAFSTRCGRS
jgi:hypothetical protein